MSQRTFTFKLKKAAKKTGGDRYTCAYPQMDWDIYFPQIISRPNGAISVTIRVEVIPEEDEIKS